MKTDRLNGVTIFHLDTPSRNRSCNKKSSARRGIYSIELLVAAVLLMTVMTFVTTLMFRVNRVWSEIGQHRVAAMELSNQLDQLTRLTRDEATLAIKSLQPSSLCRSTCPEPTLVGETSADELGIRIELQINWQRLPPGPPVVLSGWLTTAAANPANSAQRNDSSETDTQKSSVPQTESPGVDLTESSEGQR